MCTLLLGLDIESVDTKVWSSKVFIGSSAREQKYQVFYYKKLP